MMALEFLVKQLFKLSCLNELCQAVFPPMGDKLSFLFMYLCRGQGDLLLKRNKVKGGGGHLCSWTHFYARSTKNPHPST